MQLEGEAIGTSFAANDSTKDAFAAFIKGSEWMIYVDEETKQEHWDFVRRPAPPSEWSDSSQSVVGRFVAFNTLDLQAISDINFNVTKLAAATADFTDANDLSESISRLRSNGTDKLLGNNMFYAADYMVSAAWYGPLLTPRSIDATTSSP